jgi:hypothetical protein
MPRLSRFFRIFLLAPALAACGSIPTKTFEIDAIDDEEKPVPAIVVVGEDWVGAADRHQFVNVDNKDDRLPLKLSFEHGDVEITVAEILVDPDTGKPTRVPRSRSDPSKYLVPDPRRLRATDPTVELFMFTRR